MPKISAICSSEWSSCSLAMDCLAYSSMETHIARDSTRLPRPRTAWGELFRADGVPLVGEVQGIFDRVLHLSHISRPAVIHERPQGFRREPGDVAGMRVAETLEKVGGQRRDVLLSFPERRQKDGDDVQAEEKVFAERSVPDGLFEIPVRGRDDPDIELPDLGVPDPAAFPFLEKTEQLDLRRRRDLSDLVEEEPCRRRRPRGCPDGP
ncbi:MAG: hypothetical protein MZW92_61555 [Comamonadaceae bacterium]|nr:hypothetical protein [Comamonadaceae bacterium]